MSAGDAFGDLLHRGEWHAGSPIGEGFQHPGGAGAGRAVGKELDAADAQIIIAKACAQPQRNRFAQPLAG